MPKLIAREGPLAGRRFDLDGEMVLGREGATITLDDEETSRRHAAIRVVDNKTIIEDLGSTNGTFVDGRRIDAPTELKGGEKIKLGQTVFHLEVEVAPVVEPVADAGATRLAQRPAPVDPDQTRLRSRPESKPAAPQPREPAAPAEPDETRLRPRPAPPEPTAPSEPADSGRTSIRPRPPAGAPVPAAAAPSAPPPAPARSPAPAPAGRAPAEQPFGAFAPPAGRRRRGVATRKLAPSLLSFATILITAVALVVYFVGR